MRKLLYVMLLGVLIAAPFAGAYPVFVLKVLCFALFASAFNLVMGYTGLLSFGHAAFFGGGGYVAGWAITTLGVGPGMGLVLGTLAGALLGLVFGALAIRRDGIYFAMVTLALAQMFYFFCVRAPFTGGEDGMQGVPRGVAFGILDLNNDLSLYYFGLAVIVAAFLLIARVVHSPFGRVLAAMKGCEPRMTSLGYSVHRSKLLVFVLSAGIAGLAGALKVLVLGFESLVDVHWTTSGAVILMTLVGGLGMLSGPLLGATLLMALDTKLGEFGHALARVTRLDFFAAIGDSVITVTGVIFVVCVLAFRKGVMGEIALFLKRFEPH
jgi:branched-chain amino acid transport system permease protein